MTAHNITNAKLQTHKKKNFPLTEMIDFYKKNCKLQLGLSAWHNWFKTGSSGQG